MKQGTCGFNLTGSKEVIHKSLHYFPDQCFSCSQDWALIEDCWAHDQQTPSIRLNGCHWRSSRKSHQVEVLRDKQAPFVLVGADGTVDQSPSTGALPTELVQLISIAIYAGGSWLDVDGRQTIGLCIRMPQAPLPYSALSTILLLRACLRTKPKDRVSVAVRGECTTIFDIRLDYMRRSARCIAMSWQLHSLQAFSSASRAGNVAIFKRLRASGK